MRAVSHSRSLFVSNVLGAVGIVFLGTLPSAAATLYVDGGNALCSDAGSGTAAIPYCTIGKGATVAVAGDTVLVSSGVYPEYVKVAQSGTGAAPITIRAADLADVVVSGQFRSFEISTKSWITISGFTVSGTSSYGIYVNNSSNIIISGNHVTTAGLPVAGSTRAGIYVNGTSDSTVAGNTTDHNTDAGILVTNGSTRVTVVGNISSFNARGYIRAAPGIDVRSGGNTIKGNMCHDNEDTGIQVYAFALGVPSPDNLIVNNLCYDNGDHGIDINSGGSQRIIGNTVYKNVTTGINVEGPSSGTILANNISVDNAINSPGTRGNIRVDATSIVGTTIDYDEVFMSLPGQVQIVWGSTSYATLAAFVGAIGQEAHGQEGDPRWVSPGSGDFHLTGSSPGIDSANSDASGALDTDLENHPRVDDLAVADTGAGPRAYDDRGCYEYQPAGTVCGDGIRDSGEQCDGTDLGGATCQSQGFYCFTGSGIACNANCTFNTSACVSETCDDGDACNGVETCNDSTGCAAGIPVVCTAADQCHVAGTCAPGTGLCSNPNAPDGTTCNDGDATTTLDACRAGVCVGTSPCGIEPKPKSAGYYKKLCKDGHGKPSSTDALTAADAVCVGQLTTTFAGISTVDDLCAVFNHDSSDHDTNGLDCKGCRKGEQELMGLALNICRQRVCPNQEVDSACGADHDSHHRVLTTVAASLATADSLLSNPARTKAQCKEARCLAKEINNGRGLHHVSLMLEKAPGNGTRLNWASPVMDDGSGEASQYTIWRRPMNTDAVYVKLLETTALTYVDDTAGDWEYEVTFKLAR